MKKFAFLFAALILMIVGCTDNELIPEPESGSFLKSSNAKIKIAVMSDMHYMDRTLLPEDISACPDFQKMLVADGYKLTEISDPIFRAAVAEIKAEKPDIVLIPGDMSKDGEKLNHEKVRELLQQFLDDGIMVFVVPGNNDINNLTAASYANNIAEAVPHISPSEFVEIYNDCGYEGSERDPNSLSYLSKPFPNLWILGIDACKYPPSYPKTSRSGLIKPATLSWIQEVLADAGDDVTVFAMMHHGIMEHFQNNITINQGTVLDNWEASSQVFMDAGIRFVFTGHNHGNDITELKKDGKILTDIETGALTTPVSPFRILVLDDNYMNVETRYIKRIDYPLPENMGFTKYCDMAISNRLDLFYKNILSPYFGVSSETANLSAPFVRKATMAQYCGDENINPVETMNIEQLEETTSVDPKSPYVILAIESFWTDLPPKDNNIHFKLK